MSVPNERLWELANDIAEEFCGGSDAVKECILGKLLAALASQEPIISCNRCANKLCEHDNCTAWECARACSKCAPVPKLGASQAPGAAESPVLTQLVTASKVALGEMCRTVAPRDSFTDAVDGLDRALNSSPVKQTARCKGRSELTLTVELVHDKDLRELLNDFIEHAQF